MAHTQPTPAVDAQVQDNISQRATLIGTLAHLWPYIWPGDRVEDILPRLRAAAARAPAGAKEMVPEVARRL